MRKNAAFGFLFVVGVLLVWSAFIGHTGVILAALLCPQQLHIEGGADQGDLQEPVAPNPLDPGAPNPPEPQPPARRPPPGVRPILGNLPGRNPPSPPQRRPPAPQPPRRRPPPGVRPL